MLNDVNNMLISNCLFVIILIYFVVVVLIVFWILDSLEMKRKFVNILLIE